MVYSPIRREELSDNMIRRFYLDCRYLGQSHAQPIESTESRLGISVGANRSHNNRGESF